MNMVTPAPWQKRTFCWTNIGKYWAFKDENQHGTEAER